MKHPTLRLQGSARVEDTSAPYLHAFSHNLGKRDLTLCLVLIEG